MEHKTATIVYIAVSNLKRHSSAEAGEAISNLWKTLDEKSTYRLADQIKLIAKEIARNN